MSTWEGFTEEDLNRVQGSNQAGSKAAHSNQAKNATTQRKMKKVVVPDFQDEEEDNRMVSKDVAPSKPLSQVTPVQKHSSAESVATGKQLPELVEVPRSNYLSGVPSIVQKKENKLSAAIEPVVRDRLNLDEFEERRRMIEEQNRQKKETLSKALSARKQKTAEEAFLLHQIQEELHRLDAQLSGEVAILRKHIESVSLTLTDAQKRYERAELEFIEAKKELYDKKEKKELLTEHLCTIIEQNEVRKANKLSELLRQLDGTTAAIEPPVSTPATMASPLDVTTTV